MLRLTSSEFTLAALGFTLTALTPPGLFMALAGLANEVNNPATARRSAANMSAPNDRTNN